MLSSLKLQRTTLIGKDQLKKLKTIWQSLSDNNQSFQFRNPVDWKGMGLTDYTFIIKHPMDLGTINRKLRQEKYQFVEQVLDDIQLIWDNCKAYNQSGSWIYNIAQKLERSFKKMIRNYLPNVPIIIPGRKPQQLSQQGNNIYEDEIEQISYNEKLKFSEKLKNLSPQDLGTIVQKIMKQCVGAFKQTDSDKAQILVDNFDPAFFRKINEQVDDLTNEFEQKLRKKVKLA